MRLHTTVGPSATSLSAVAEEAGVTRVTLYRHFPSMDELFVACMSHWRALHPPPDPTTWRRVEGFDARLRHAIAELYTWYDANAGDLEPIYRDAAFAPASARGARRDANERMVAAILDAAHRPARGRRRLGAAALHVVSFPTWRSLTVDGGLGSRDAVDLACRFVLAARVGGR